MAKETADPRVLDALISLQEIAVENRSAAAAAIVKADAIGKPKPTLKETFHKLHTGLLAPANMAAQMTMAAVMFRPGPLLQEPAFEEGVRFFVYTAWGYMVPAVVLVLFHSQKIPREVWLTLGWIFVSVFGIVGVLTYFDRF